VVKSSGPVLFKPNTRSRSENVIWEGKPARALIMPVQITPLVPGESEVNCQVIVHVSRSSFGIRGALSQSTIDVPSARIRVLPLPQVRPAGFTGAVGQFTVAQPRLSTTEAEVGEPLVMTVALTGEGNVDGVPAPELEPSAEWNAYRPTSEVQREDESGGGTKIFTYTLIPKQAGRRGTPAIPFAFFDPVKRTFVDLTIPPQPVVIKASSAPAAVPGATNVSETPAPGEPPREAAPTLTGIAEHAGAWHTAPGPNLPQFLWLQTIPPLVLLALWGWRRRAEYLEKTRRSPGAAKRGRPLGKRWAWRAPRRGAAIPRLSCKPVSAPSGRPPRRVIPPTPKVSPAKKCCASCTPTTARRAPRAPSSKAPMLRATPRMPRCPRNRSSCCPSWSMPSPA
jgi:hypothetical protein